MSRIIVTGASGFIGSNLVARLVKEGHWVRGVDVKDTPHRAHLYEQGVVWRADLRDEAQAKAALCGANVVFHLAADHGGAGYFHSDADWKAAMNNLRIDQNVLKISKDTGVGRLFFASSACTYPVSIQGPDAFPLKESDWGVAPAEALYGEAKRMTHLLMDGAREHGLDARCGIFHTIYGPGQDYEEPRAKFPTAICRKILEDPERVEVWGDGTAVRTFLYIEDALDRIQTLMREPYQGPVNIGSDEEVTIQQCADWAAEAAGATPEWVYTDGPVGVAHRSADNTVWNARYGEGDLTSAKDGFAETLEWMKAELPELAKGAV